ncbi:MAG: LysM peptidoglycan-binding domain-containing protein [Phycisphaerales bacterium]|nr:LysM peptidoglycan-binding domain-containing protein [Phycisphaerales bacterium]
MRTDVKIGLVSVLALVLIVVAYVVFAHHHATQVSDNQIASPQPPLVTANEPATLPAVMPPAVESPATEPGAAVPDVVGLPTTNPSSGTIGIIPGPSGTVPTTPGGPSDNALSGATNQIASNQGAGSLGGNGSTGVGNNLGGTGNTLSDNDNALSGDNNTANTPSNTLGGSNDLTGQNAPSSGSVSSNAGSTYSIRRGDTLAAISKRVYGNTRMIRSIERANPGVDARHLRIGQKIHLPAASSSSTGGTTSSHRRHHYAAVRTRRHYSHEPAGGRIYVVRRGDTLYAIARREYHNGGDWRLIYRANHRLIGSHPSNLRAGEHLVIPAKH